MRGRRGRVGRWDVGVWVLLGAAVLPGAGATQAPDAAADLVAMERLLSRAEALGFSGQVLYAEDGRVLLHRAYGWADRAGRRLFTTATPSGVASVSKQLTAAAVLALRDQGRLSLDDPVGRHLPELPDDKRGITLAQLLTHTGAMPPGDLMDDFELADGAAVLARVAAAPLRGAPGSRWRYSNAGYNLLALVVDRVTGLPRPEAMRHLVFGPAGMVQTGVGPPAGGEPPAHPYAADADQGDPRTWPPNGRTLGGGDVFSTAGDLFRFHRAVQDGRLFHDSTAAAFHRAVVEIGPEGSGDGYGYGVFVRDNADEGHVVEHGGDWERGYNAAFFRWDQGRRVLTLVSNAQDAAGFSLRHSVMGELDRLARGVAPRFVPPEAQALAPERAAELEGRYPVDGGVVSLRFDGGLLWASAEGQGAVDLLLGADEAARAVAAASNARARELMEAELAGRDGFGPALREDGAPFLGDYRSEWEATVAPLGAGRSAEVLGTTLGSGSASTLVAVHGRDGTAWLTFHWRDGGAGRLGGMEVRPGWRPAPAPVAYPVAAAPGGGLVGYDLFREVGVRFVVDDGRLVVRGPA